MRTFASILALTISASASYLCPATLSSADAAAITYGYKVQKLLDNYYSSISVNASFFSDLSMASAQQSNGETKAENVVTNINGLARQASLGSQALLELGQQIGLSLDDGCSYKYPQAPNGTAHIMNAFYFEATMCGAFIGLADYVESPVAAFLAARLAAEHGIHASALRSMMQAVGFMPNSTSLTPAFTPSMIMQEGMTVGHLGSWLNGCAAEPAAPCGGQVMIGSLTATLNNQTSTAATGSACPTATGGYANNSTVVSSGNGTGTLTNTTSTATPMPYTGAGTSLSAWKAIGISLPLLALMI